MADRARFVRGGRRHARAAAAGTAGAVRAGGRCARTGARGAAGAARAVRDGLRRAGRTARRAAHAQGAGRSGLGNLIEASTVNSAGDALVAVALAGTLFFGLDVNQARGQVALYLLVSMAPFALVAPLIGPALDRMRHVRRYALASSFVIRALLCWAMAGAVLTGDQVTFLPAAFGLLVVSKAFGVLRAAVTPLVLPGPITLVTANARASFAGLIGASVAAPIGAGIVYLAGADWLLRVAAAVFTLGVVCTLRLPRHVDVLEEPGEGPRRIWTLPRVGPAVAEAVAANAVLRAFSGFLILYLAFLLREERFDPVSRNVALGLLAACAGAGGLAGTALGTWMRARSPRMIVSATLAGVTAVTAACAALFGLWAALAVAAVAGLGQALGKLSMDAVVQQETGEELRSSTFAVTETLHQLVWVVGGLLGLGMSIVADGTVALAVVAAALAAAIGLLRSRMHGPPRGRPPRRHGPLDDATRIRA
ncbi:MFS transporter [Spirillospora albida]|uniref:MFS transporter n=1 Tax=Spirillospora albida TaxID=58123 RepID=UPI00068A55D0|nr:MFS transporter [Spirillospora albida]